MAQELTLIVDLVAVLGAATVGSYAAQQLKQPVLLGYLLAGLAVGPAGLGIVSAEGEIKVLAEIGVALLLFALGVEFSLGNLLKVRRVALGGGSLQLLLTIVLGGGLALAAGAVTTVSQALFMGAVLSLSSTAIVLKSLIERNEVQTVHGQVMLGILIVQDIGLGLMLAILPTLTKAPDQVGQALLRSLLTAILFFLGAYLMGQRVVPQVMRRVARTGSQELFVLSVFALCLGVAVLTASLGLGIEMGAFVAGLMISQVEYADHALHSVLPMRDVFATLFFASIGMLIDPVFLVQNIGALLGLVMIVMLGKALIVTPLVKLSGYPLRTALTVGIGINQIGEFSFVLAGVALELGEFDQNLYGLTVGATAITLVLTPFVHKMAPYLFRALEQVPMLRKWLSVSQFPGAISAPTLTGHCVVAGYGRVGQTLVRMLRSQGHAVLVIDNDESMLQVLKDEQIPYLFGDASSELVMRKARLAKAKALAIALPDPLATRLTLKRALSLVPDLDVTVRAHANQEIDVLYQLGAREVVQPEFEASLEMGAHVLLNLGDPVHQVYTIINSYRANRYREIVPERLEYLAATELEVATEGLEGHWYPLPETSPLVGQTIAHSQVRRLTGSTIMAIRRGLQVYRYPDSSTTLMADDRLLIVGNTRERRSFEVLLMGQRHGQQSAS